MVSITTVPQLVSRSFHSYGTVVSLTVVQLFQRLSLDTAKAQPFSLKEGVFVFLTTEIVTYGEDLGRFE